MKIAAAGCIHGRFKLLEDALERSDENVELILLCGDLQTPRPSIGADLQSIPVSQSKQHFLGPAAKEYEAVYFRPSDESAPRKSRSRLTSTLTIFVGGNHEASNLLTSLPYGGYIRPNLYYAGRSSILTYKGLNIACISGIFKQYDYRKSLNLEEKFTENQKRNIYHIREQDLRIFQDIPPGYIDIVMTHDWPTGMAQNLNYETFTRIYKPRDFKQEYLQNKIGCPHFLPLLNRLKPKVWLSAHHHVWFHSKIEFESNTNASEGTPKFCNFVALPKVMEKAHGGFIHYFDVEIPKSIPETKIFDPHIYLNAKLVKYYQKNMMNNNLLVASAELDDHENNRIQYSDNISDQYQQSLEIIMGLNIHKGKMKKSESSTGISVPKNDDEISL